MAKAEPLYQRLYPDDVESKFKKKVMDSRRDLETVMVLDHCRCKVNHCLLLQWNLSHSKKITKINCRKRIE